MHSNARYLIANARYLRGEEGAYLAEVSVGQQGYLARYWGVPSEVGGGTWLRSLRRRTHMTAVLRT
eukprot:1256234-Rhodomonas_salina.1